MMNNNGRAALVILLIIMLLAVAVYAVMTVPEAQPIKDYIATVFPSISSVDTTEDIIAKAPVGQIPLVPSQEQQPDTGEIATPPTGEQPAQTPEQQAGMTPAPGSLITPQSGGFPVAGILNSLGIGGAPTTDAVKPAQDKSDNSPVAILQSCMSKLKSRDIIGAEIYISENGRKYTVNGMTGVHKLLLKNVIDTRAFDEIGYADTKIAGQTAWVPIYSKLDAKNKIVSLYIILANRGDGWRVDDLYDPRR